MTTETRHAICRFCHAMCAVKLTMEDGRITGIIGDRDNPVYHGYSCVKGRNFHEFHYSSERVTQPVRRTADGSFAPVSLDRALEEIGDRLAAIIEEYGPRSVAMYSGTFSHFCPAGVMTRHAFMDAIGSPMRFTNATIDQPGKPIAMALHGRWGAGPQPFETADVCLVIGANPLVSMWGGVPPFNPARRLHEARKRGLELIVIDPRRTETARKADIHLQCLPGNDAAILAAIIRVVIAEGLHDSAFVEAETQGFEALRAAVQPFTPERVAAAAGLDADDIRASARMFAAAGRGIATGGTGSNMAPHGTLMEYLVLALNSICGRWLRAGETLPNAGVLFRMYPGTARAEKPRPAWGFGERLRVRGLTDTAAGLPTAALADEILTPGEGRVRALFVVGGNPLANWPNRQKVRQALDSLDLLVTIDPQMSATAQCADYVIGPKFGFELPATTFASEGIVFYGLSLGMPEPWAQYQPVLIDPPEGSEVVEDWRVFYELARRMELDLAYFGAAFDMGRTPTTDELLEVFLQRAPVALEEIKGHPGGRVFPERAVRVREKAGDWPFRLELGHADMLAELATVDRELDRPSMLAQSLDGLEGRRLLLVSRRQHEVYNSVGHRLPALARKRPYNPVYLSPADAAALGVASGDPVRIATARASVGGLVEVADDVREGVVSVAHGFPNDESLDTDFGAGTSVSALLDDEIDYDPVSGLPVMSAVPVVVSAGFSASATYARERSASPPRSAAKRG
ncbi:MAG: molybdopterin-dependent oxidoreductase [Lysobacterales bacterium]|jgi:anaerobic selenocysteine-containing dehydrogenase